MRKDGRTPYVAHPMRVCLALNNVFGVTDTEVLAAALLHDTIEDTKTDFDDISEEFGLRVAQLVAALTKDKRLPEHEREQRYVTQIINGGGHVQLLKLADIYDNLADTATLVAEQRSAVFARSIYYLSQLKPALAQEAKEAFAIVEHRLKSLRQSTSH